MHPKHIAELIIVFWVDEKCVLEAGTLGEGENLSRTLVQVGI